MACASFVGGKHQTMARLRGTLARAEKKYNVDPDEVMVPVFFDPFCRMMECCCFIWSLKMRHCPLSNNLGRNVPKG
jgi:hypothetical protein